VIDNLIFVINQTKEDMKDAFERTVLYKYFEKR